MFDPTKPANGTLIAAPELRAQFTALNTDLQTRALNTDLSAQIADTPHNCASVQTLAELGISFGDTEKQQLADKLTELITALRR